MKRYSDRAIEIINELHTERLDYGSEYLPLIECANQCKAYEDTGLEPEEIPTGIELAYNYACMLLLKRYQALGPVEELTAQVRARDEGRVVVLPCKVGDKAFALDTEDEDGVDDCIFEGSIVAINIGVGGITVSVGHMECKCWFSETERRLEDLHTDWYLDKAEAEAAQREEGQDG